MILKFVATLLICGFLCPIAFCQEQKVEATSAAPSAKLVFYRATGYVGHILHASIKIDSDKAIHKIHDNHTWSTELPAGSHFVSGDDRVYGRTYVFENGKTYYFRVEAIQGKNQLKFRVLSVSPEIADAEMVGLQAE
jgi:hypothetical protein